MQELLERRRATRNTKAVVNFYIDSKNKFIKRRKDIQIIVLNNQLNKIK